MLKARLDRAEAEAIARVKAEREAAATALWDWLKANSTPAEYDAYDRVFFADFISAALERQAAGAALSKIDLNALDIHAQLGPLRPDDRAAAEALDARIPPELIERVKVAFAVCLPDEPVE